MVRASARGMARQPPVVRRARWRPASSWYPRFVGRRWIATPALPLSSAPSRSVEQPRHRVSVTETVACVAPRRQFARYGRGDHRCSTTAARAPAARWPGVPRRIPSPSGARRRASRERPRGAIVGGAEAMSGGRPVGGECDRRLDARDRRYGCSLRTEGANPGGWRPRPQPHALTCPASSSP